MNDTSRQLELIDIQKQIDSLKTKKARYEGKKEEWMKELKSQGCSSIEDLRSRIKELDIDIEKKEKRFDSKISKFVDKYDLGE